MVQSGGTVGFLVLAKAFANGCSAMTGTEALRVGLLDSDVYGPSAPLMLGIAVSSADAQLYKWVDKDGKVSYSDMPPPRDVKDAKQKNYSDNIAGPSDDLPFVTRDAMKRISRRCPKGCWRMPTRRFTAPRRSAGTGCRWGRDSGVAAESGSANQLSERF